MATGGGASVGTATMTSGVGTPLWMAPELLVRGHKYGQPIDVYSFSIVMWELATRATPREADIDERDDARFCMALYQAVRDGQRPSIPPDSEFGAAYFALMQQCWSKRPDDRPAFVSIVQTMESFELPVSTVTSGSRNTFMQHKLIGAQEIRNRSAHYDFAN